MNAEVDALAVLTRYVGPSPGDEHLSVARWLSWVGAATHVAIRLGGQSVAIDIDDIGVRAGPSTAPKATAMNPVDTRHVAIFQCDLELYDARDLIILLEHCWR